MIYKRGSRAAPPPSPARQRPRRTVRRHRRRHPTAAHLRPPPRQPRTTPQPPTPTPARPPPSTAVRLPTESSGRAVSGTMTGRPGERSLRGTLDERVRHDAVVSIPARNSTWRIMPPRARLVVTILGVIAIVGFIVDIAAHNTWASAIAIAALFGAMVISYNYRPPRARKHPPGDSGTPVP